MLTIHSGSRNFGKCIADYHQDIAIKQCMNTSNVDIKAIIAKLKVQYNGKELERQISLEKDKVIKVPKDQCYLTGEFKDEYIADSRVAQNYATLSRYVMAYIAIKFLGLELKDLDVIESAHNFIGDDGIIRKGAIQANKGQKVVIPLNMKDGILIGIGKGNAEYNNSAPHGAGRLLSRSKAKATLSTEDFKEDMKNVFSTSVGQSTLDESPRAYKDSEMIKEYLQPTVTIIGHYLPIHNMKDK
jgi:RNA-splicing ligase RtcB